MPPNPAPEFCESIARLLESLLGAVNRSDLNRWLARGWMLGDEYQAQKQRLIELALTHPRQLVLRQRALIGRFVDDLQSAAVAHSKELVAGSTSIHEVTCGYCCLLYIFAEFERGSDVKREVEVLGSLFVAAVRNGPHSQLLFAGFLAELEECQSKRLCELVPPSTVTAFRVCAAEVQLGRLRQVMQQQRADLAASGLTELEEDANAVLERHKPQASATRQGGLPPLPLT